MIDLQPLTVGAKSKYLGEGKKTHRFRLYPGQTHAATCHVVASPKTLRRRTCLRLAPSFPTTRADCPWRGPYLRGARTGTGTHTFQATFRRCRAPTALFVL